MDLAISRHCYVCGSLRLQVRQTMNSPGFCDEFNPVQGVQRNLWSGKAPHTTSLQVKPDRQKLVLHYMQDIYRPPLHHILYTIRGHLSTMTVTVDGINNTAAEGASSSLVRAAVARRYGRHKGWGLRWVFLGEATGLHKEGSGYFEDPTWRFSSRYSFSTYRVRQSLQDVHPCYRF